jgi:hypothetical protein
MRKELPFVVKRYIVQRLAQHDTPSQVAADVKKDFPELLAEFPDLAALDRQRVAYYDPTTKAGAALAPELKALFETTRKEFLDNIDRIPIANKAVRLKHLNRQLDYFADKNAGGMVAELCEAAAKEVGNAFTNRRELSGPNGAPIQTEDTSKPAPSAEQIKNEFAALFAAASDAGEPAEDQAGGDRVLPAGADGGSAAQPADVPASAPVAVPERPVLPARHWMQEE